jgi:hypothetical protein
LEIITKIEEIPKNDDQKVKNKIEVEPLQLIRRMFPHGTTYPIYVESGIQLNMSACQFPCELCILMMNFQAAVDDPINYLIRKVLPKLVKKHLRVRKKLGGRGNCLPNPDFEIARV